MALGHKLNIYGIKWIRRIHRQEPENRKTNQSETQKAAVFQVWKGTEREGGYPKKMKEAKGGNL